jgi:hypothetical protein
VYLQVELLQRVDVDQLRQQRVEGAPHARKFRLGSEAASCIELKSVRASVRGRQACVSQCERALACRPPTQACRPLTLAHTGLPPSHTGLPASHTGLPPSYTGLPPSHTGLPPSHTGSHWLEYRWPRAAPPPTAPAPPRRGSRPKSSRATLRV